MHANDNDTIAAAAERAEMRDIVGRPKDQFDVMNEVFDHIFKAFGHVGKDVAKNPATLPGQFID